MVLDREAQRWRRWITALAAGPLGRLVADARGDLLVHPDSLARLWREAAREIAWRLLACAARERLLDATRTQDCLSVVLSGATIELPLARAGAFELDWPALDSIVDPHLDDPLALVDLLGERQQLAIVDRVRLRAEIVDSIANLAQARLARALRDRLAEQPGYRDDRRLGDPEHFVTDGHPWHPMNRTRLGLHRAEVVRYASDQLAATPVGCVDVELGHARIAGDYLDAAPRWFGEPPPGFVRLPLHPAQRRRIPELFPRLWADGTLRPVEGPAIPCRSLLSLRTLELDRDWHLKLACDVLTTSTRRWVSPMSVHNGPEVTRMLLDIQAEDPITATLALMQEPAAAGLEPERVGSAAGQLGAILRTAPRETERERAWVCAALGERWPGTNERVLERAAAGYPGGRRERIAALIDDWIAALVPPALRLYCCYGVALELHLQNTLVRVVDGRVAGFWVRDLGGIRIHTPRLSTARLASPPSFAASSFIVTDDLDEVRGKLEHTLFHAHLAHLFAVAGTLGINEAANWTKLRDCVERSLNAWAADPLADVELRARLREELRELTRPRVRAKALLRMRLHERSSDYDYTEVANALARPT